MPAPATSQTRCVDGGRVGLINAPRGERMATTAEANGLIERWALLAATMAALVYSAIAPHDRMTWAMEVSWVVIALPVLVATHGRFPLTPLLYRLLFVHALILILGGSYTYARVPLGFWFADLFDLTRNHYDRLGHLAQGFVPAILAREILVRCSPLAGSRWIPVVVVSMCLAFSAFFELIEWWSALILGAGADAFLATQGDPWDTQSDMACALIGAIAALALLGRLHDRHLSRLMRMGELRPGPQHA
jgi:putative membrane protein